MKKNKTTYSLTYSQIEKLVLGRALPRRATNGAGEHITVSKGKDSKKGSFFQITTYQMDGKKRVNTFYKDTTNANTTTFDGRWKD